MGVSTFIRMGGQLGFRSMNADDLRLMHEWLQRPHVKRWWSKRETYEEVVEHYLPAIEGDEPTDLFVIEFDERPVGFIQRYLVSDHPDYAGTVSVGADVAGIDLFIAEEELTGSGLGSEAIRAFVRDVVFAQPRTIACIADPEVRNGASVGAFEKAGFRPVREFVDPADGAVHCLMRVDRSGGPKVTNS
jgi:aminoglycoside 6'-N-acetyltransferase